MQECIRLRGQEMKHPAEEIQARGPTAIVRQRRRPHKSHNGSDVSLARNWKRQNTGVKIPQHFVW